jgi:hypothetical protein
MTAQVDGSTHQGAAMRTKYTEDQLEAMANDLLGRREYRRNIQPKPREDPWITRNWPLRAAIKDWGEPDVSDRVVIRAFDPSDFDIRFVMDDGRTSVGISRWGKDRVFQPAL